MNSLGQENALGYPYPKWHPYYGWGWGPGAAPQPQRLIGDPGIYPSGHAPGNWFGRPLVGAPTFRREDATSVRVGAGLIVGGAAYLATKSVVSALVGGGAAALLVSLLPIWTSPAEPQGVHPDPRRY